MARNTHLLTHFGGASNNSLTDVIKNNYNNDNIILGDPELDYFTQSDYLVYYLDKHILELSILNLKVQFLHAKIDELKIVVTDRAQLNINLNSTHYVYNKLGFLKTVTLF